MLVLVIKSAFVYSHRITCLTSMCKFGPNMCSTTLLWISQSASSLAMDLEDPNRTEFSVQKHQSRKLQHVMLQDVSAVTLDVNLPLVNPTGVNRADRSVCLWMHHLWKLTAFHKWVTLRTSLRFCVGHQRLVVADVVESVELVLRKTHKRRQIFHAERRSSTSFIFVRGYFPSVPFQNL